MSITLFRYLHFFGIVFWVGSVVSIAYIATAPSQPGGGLPASLRRVLRRVTVPSMVIAFAGGLGMLIPNFTSVYAKAGWMHGKLLLLLLLAGATGVLSAKLRKWAEGQEVPHKTFGRIALLTFVLATVIVTLAVYRPGS